MSAAPTSEFTEPVQPRPKFHLLRWFAVSGAIAISVFSVAMAYLLDRFIETRLLEHDAAISHGFVQSIANIQQVAMTLKAADSKQTARNPRFSEFIEHLGAMPGVLRVNVYTPQRTILWSTREEMVGRRFDDNDELEEALRGRVIAHPADASAAQTPAKAEHMMLSGPGNYVENYMPVSDSDGRVIAVIELYRRPDALYEAIRSGQRLMTIGAGAGGLFLFACLMGFVLHTDRRLQDQQRQLVDAEAMAIVGEISAAVAHSIRNPLGSIRSSAELQRELTGDPDGVHTQTMRHVDRIEKLVRSMLTYAADTPQHMVLTDLAAVVADVGGKFAQELARQGKRLELDLQQDIGRVNLDLLLIQQMLKTLLTNAAEATSEGGCVRLHTCREGTNAVVEVIDDGVGIAPDHLGQVLKPFFTTKPRGLGMGLALAHRVARRLGGDIEISSTPEQGTRVRVTLPTRTT